MWEYKTEDGSHDMFMDLDEDIRFRVVEENFYDTLPTDGVCSLDWNFFPSLTPQILHAVQPKPNKDAAALSGNHDNSTIAPYSIIVSAQYCDINIDMTVSVP